MEHDARVYGGAGNSDEPALVVELPELPHQRDAAAQAGTENRFPGKPFQHAGITCERCHGAGKGHGEGKGPIVNPAKLPAETRDAICMECHFEGAVAIQQPAKHIYQFQPGEQLSEYIHYFLLRRESQPEKPQALSQFEALSLSACKRRSGEKMWCGSCHDSHSEPAEKEKAAYFRGKCLACHGETFAAKHHPDKPDCMQCHMPALPSKDVAHTESTDHRILRISEDAQLPQLQVRGKPLKSFPGAPSALATTRDFALAWENLAQRGTGRRFEDGGRIFAQSGEGTARGSGAAGGPGVRGTGAWAQNEARELYRRALKIDPRSTTAATNLGILEARSGNLQRAVELWQAAFERVPYRSADWNGSGHRILCRRPEGRGAAVCGAGVGVQSGFWEGEVAAGTYESGSGGVQAVSVGIGARSRFLLYGMTRAAREARTLRPDAAGPRAAEGGCPHRSRNGVSESGSFALHGMTSLRFSALDFSARNRQG